MVGEGVDRQVARAESRCKEGSGRAPPIAAAPFRIVDRSRRDEEFAELCERCVQAAERALGLLQLREIRFARDRKLCQRCAAGDTRGIDVGENPRPARSFPLRVRDLAGKRGQQNTFPLLGVAGFEAVVVLRHRIGGRAQNGPGRNFGAGNIAHKIRMGYKKLIFGLFPFPRRAGNFLPSTVRRGGQEKHGFLKKGELMSPTAKGISEDWLSVWIGLLVFVLALGMLSGMDVLGWVVTTGVWTDISKALNPVSKAYSALSGVGALIATYIALLVVMT